MNIYVIIAAGGTGTRMQSAMPKQYLLLNEKPIIYYTIQQFKKAVPNIKCIIVVPPNYLQQTQKILQENNIAENCTVIAGGKTRFHSVQNGIAAINETEAILLVHDAARCLVSVNLIQKCVQTTIEKGNAVPAILLTDSIRQVNEKNTNKIIDRNLLRSIQTPQTFYLHTLQKAFAQKYIATFTDEASVVELIGKKINLIDGESTNIKITNPIDLIIAEQFLKKIED